MASAEECKVKSSKKLQCKELNFSLTGRDSTLRWFLNHTIFSSDGRLWRGKVSSCRQAVQLDYMLYATTAYASSVCERTVLDKKYIARTIVFCDRRLRLVRDRYVCGQLCVHAHTYQVPLQSRAMYSNVDVNRNWYASLPKRVTLESAISSDFSDYALYAVQNCFYTHVVRQGGVISCGVFSVARNEWTCLRETVNFTKTAPAQRVVSSQLLMHIHVQDASVQEKHSPAQEFDSQRLAVYVLHFRKYICTPYQYTLVYRGNYNLILAEEYEKRQRPGILRMLKF